MIRICPNCKSKLNGSSNYFCSSCGSELPKNLWLSPISARNVRRIIPQKSKQNHLSKVLDLVFGKVFHGVNTKRIVLGLLLIGIVVAIVFVVPKYLDFVQESEEESTFEKVSGEKNSYKNSISLEIGLTESDFNQFSVVDYIPYDVDFYFEFSDFDKFDELFGFLGNDLVSLGNSLKDKVSPFFAAFLKKESPSIDSGQEENFVWSFVLFPAEGYGGVSGEYESLYIQKIEGAIVISPSEEIVNEVRNAKMGLSKSLSLHPSFVSIKSDLPLKGKVFMLSLTNEGILELKQQDFSGEFDLIVKSFVDSNADYLVIL